MEGVLELPHHDGVVAADVEAAGESDFTAEVAFGERGQLDDIVDPVARFGRRERRVRSRSVFPVPDGAISAALMRASTVPSSAVRGSPKSGVDQRCPTMISRVNGIEVSPKWARTSLIVSVVI